MSIRRRLFPLALLGVASLATVATITEAHEYYMPGMVFIHPWADPTEPGVKSAPVYFSLDGVSSSNRIVRAVSPMAEKVEFRGAGPAAKAPKLKALDIKPDGETVFVEGKPHIVLTGLKEPLQWGRSYEMTLYFEKGGALQVMVSVGAH